MDPSQFEHVNWVILGSIVGFLLLAFILLYPVYRFLNREEEASRSWTPDQIAHRQRRRGDGSPTGEPELRRPPPPSQPEDGAS
jgi:hypothetical protein